MNFHSNGVQATDFHVDRLRNRVVIDFLRLNEDAAEGDPNEWEIVFSESRPLDELRDLLRGAS